MRAIDLMNVLASTIPPTTGGGSERAQEPISHEPWVTILLAIIAGVFSTIAAWFGYLGHERAKEAKATAEEVHSTVKTTFEATVGIPNGHGNVMEQLSKLAQNQHDIQQTQARDSQALTEYQMHADEKMERIHARVSRVDDKVDNHVKESAVYRADVKEKLSEALDKVDAVDSRLSAHDQWERAQKYAAQAPASPPEDPNPAPSPQRPRKPRNTGGH